jgi:DNA polymerase elongation subunit (family B)
MINVKKATKTELEWLATHRCRHSHTYLDHQQCLVSESPEGEPGKRTIGYFDIESTHLKANLGYMISFKVFDAHNNKMYGRTLTSKEITSFTFDRDLIRELVVVLRRFTHLVGFYCKDRRHDFPFVRTRAMIHGIDFPTYGELQVIDLYDLAKNKMSLHSHRLQVVCETLGIPAKSHPLVGEIWIKSACGHQPSLDYIDTHCEEDVVCLVPVLERLEPFYRRSKLSV